MADTNPLSYLLASGNAGRDAFLEGTTSDVADITKGGQMGYMPDLAVINASALYVRKNIVPFVIQTPLGFEDLPEPEKWIAAVKAMFERHATRIEGLRSTVNVEWVETPVGGAGEMQQDVGNITRERSEPSITLPERKGRPFGRLLEGWIYNLMGDPETKVPMVMTRALRKSPNILPQYTGATVMFIEPDVTHTKVEKAWLCTNMMPQSSGPIEGSRDLTAGGEILELQITFSAITKVGYGVNVYAQQLLDELNLIGANPSLAPAFVDAIDADVASQEVGYADQINQANTTFLTP